MKQKKGNASAGYEASEDYPPLEHILVSLSLSSLLSLSFSLENMMFFCVTSRPSLQAMAKNKKAANYAMSCEEAVKAMKRVSKFAKSQMAKPAKTATTGGLTKAHLKKMMLGKIVSKKQRDEAVALLCDLLALSGRVREWRREVLRAVAV